ncbi:protein mono-ADP-ribosyltransferase PARP14-like [Lithobates pipiens]
MGDYPFSIIVKYNKALNQRQEKEQRRYFTMKRKSGGGDCNITQLNPTQYRVSYKTREVMERVLNYADHKKDFCGEVIDFTMEADGNQEKTNLPSQSTEEQSNILQDGDGFAAASIPEDSSENIPLEQSTIIPLDSNFQYAVIKDRISNEICTSFSSLKIYCENKMLKLTGHGDLIQARVQIKNMIATVRERKVDVSPAIGGFLLCSDSVEISKKIFEGLAFLDILRGLRIYASSDTLLDQAEITLQQSLKVDTIRIASGEKQVISQEAWKHLLDNLNSSGDIQVVLQGDSDSKGHTLSLVGLTKAVEEGSKACKHYLWQKAFIKEEVDLEHRIVVENIENLLTSFEGDQLAVTIQVSEPPGQTVTLIGPQDEVTKCKATLQEFIQKIHVNNLCITKHGAASFFKKEGKQILDSFQDTFKCRIFVCDSENGDHRGEGAGNDQNALGCTEDVNQSEEVKLTGDASCDGETPQAENYGTAKTQTKTKENKPSVVQLVLSHGKLENKKADVLVAPLVSNNPVLEALNVTKNLQLKGGDRFKNLFMNALNDRKTLEPGSIFQLPIPGNNYPLNCKIVIFIVCLPWDGPNGSSSIAALKKGIKKLLEICNSKNWSSLTMSVIGPGLKLKVPEETAAKLIGEEIKLFVEGAQNHSLQKIEIVFPWEYQVPYIIYRETLLDMNLGDRLILCNENGGSFNNISFGQCHREKAGNMSIDVIYNDITKERTDAVVNSTNFSQWSRESVAHAIFTAAGQSIVQEAKDGATRKEIVMTGPGDLPCKWILHCNCKNNVENIPKLVTDILLQSENVGLKSVAIPAIGTGECGFNPFEVANYFVNAIALFARTRNTNSLTCVRLVTSRPHIYHIFRAQLRKHFRFASGDSWKPVDLLSSRLKQLWLPGCDAIHDITVFQHPVPAPPPTLLVIVTDNLDNVNEIQQRLKEEFDKQYKEEIIEQALLKTFSLKEIQEVFSVVNEKPEVNMILDKLQNCIFLNGCEKDILEVALKVQSKLTTIISERLQKVTTEQSGLLVQWGYTDDEDSYPFSLEANQLLENRYQTAKTGVVTVTLDNGKQAKVNLEKMTATLEVDSPEVKVIRQDLKNETNLPEHWDDMSGLLLKAVQLAQNSEEYNKVKDLYSRTVQTPIVKIERIQNKYQHIAYEMRKEFMIMKNGPDGVNERYLFHGTEPQNCQSINYSGFNRSFAGQHAARYGNGVYFAVDASYSAQQQYSPPDPNTGERFMYLTKVLVGKHTKGQSGMRTAPRCQANYTFDVYDSLTDDQNKPAMFVVFHDDQAYPEYLITFK